MDPTVEENTLNSTAGQPFTLVCTFMMPDNLIRPPIVQWLNSTGDVLSDSISLYFPVLRTSHGGEYTCTVNISIPELDIELTEDGNTNITVLSKKLSPGLVSATVHYVWTLSNHCRLSLSYSSCTQCCHWGSGYAIQWLRVRPLLYCVSGQQCGHCHLHLQPVGGLYRHVGVSSQCY